MPVELLADVKSGLRRRTRMTAALFSAATVVYFAAYLWFSVVMPVYPVVWAFVYLAGAVALTVSVLWYSARYFNPRVLAFVQSLAGRVREAQYVRGLSVAFDNGLLMTAEQNSLNFRLFLAADGTVLRPRLDELRTFLLSYRGAKRRGMASSRKGDAWMKSELDRVDTLMGSRWAVVVLFERALANAEAPSAGKWTSVGIFFTPKWAKRGDEVRAAVDDIERLLEQARTGLALR